MSGRNNEMQTKLIRLIDGPKDGVVLHCSDSSKQLKIPVMLDGELRIANYSETSPNTFSFTVFSPVQERRIIHSQQPRETQA